MEDVERRYSRIKKGHFVEPPPRNLPPEKKRVKRLVASGERVDDEFLNGWHPSPVETVKMKRCTVSAESFERFAKACSTLRGVAIVESDFLAFSPSLGLSRVFATLDHLSLAYTQNVTDELLGEIRHPADTSSELWEDGLDSLKEAFLNRANLEAGEESSGSSETEEEDDDEEQKEGKLVDEEQKNEASDGEVQTNQKGADEEKEDEEHHRAAEIIISPRPHSIPLTRLDLSGSAVTDSRLIRIAERCPHLEYVKLSLCDALTSTSISALGLLCTSLEHLDLAGCFRIADDAVAAVAYGSRMSLRSLILSGCRALQDSALLNLETCVGLETVEAVACPLLTREGIARLSEMDTLRTIKVSLCKGFCKSDAAEVDISSAAKITIVGDMAEPPRLVKRWKQIPPKRQICAQDWGFNFSGAAKKKKKKKKGGRR